MGNTTPKPHLAVQDLHLEQKILLIRGKRVMLDRDLAELYEVTVGNLNKAVKRNLTRFPFDFMFQLTAEEYDSLRFQFGILKRGKHAKYLPNAFTQEGIAMLSGILNSPRAVCVNIQIMRTFVRMRHLIESHKDLLKKIEEMEKKYDNQFHIVFDTIRQMISEPKTKIEKIGFQK